MKIRTSGNCTSGDRTSAVGDPLIDFDLFWSNAIKELGNILSLLKENQSIQWNNGQSNYTTSQFGVITWHKNWHFGFQFFFCANLKFLDRSAVHVLLSRFYPNFYQIISREKITKTGSSKIRSGQILDQVIFCKIMDKSRYNLDKVDCPTLPKFYFNFLYAKN